MKGGAAHAGCLHGTPAHKRREGCLRRRTHPRGPSHSPPYARLSRSTPEWGCHLLPTLFARAGRGRSGGGGGRCAHCAVRVSGAKGGGRTFARCSAFPICAQRQGGANPARERGRAPPLSLRVEEGGHQGGAHRRGPRGKRGWGMQTVCLHPPSLLHTRSPAMLRTEWGGH